MGSTVIGENLTTYNSVMTSRKLSKALPMRLITPATILAKINTYRVSDYCYNAEFDFWFDYRFI